MNPKTDNKPVWWGKFSLSEDQAGMWRIGPCKFWVERLSNEWRITCLNNDDPLEDTFEMKLPVSPPAEYESAAKTTRFGMSKPAEHVIITPALADRSVVIRPEIPFYILQGQKVDFFVDSPLWVKIEVGEHRVLLQNFPVYQPSDTWFGPSTMEGEFCYANRVRGRLKLEEIIFRPHRAVTVVHLRNRSEKSVFLERLSLPVPNLALYEDKDGYLWTQSVALEIMAGDKPSSLRFNQKAPSESQGAKLVCGPRQKPEENIMTRVMHYLIS
jgi:hypothetical protein